jgi:hypothetical protein
VAWGFVVLAWRGMRSGGILTRNDYRTGEKGTHGRKNPLPVTNLRRGYQRRAVWTHTHTARLGTGGRIHRSAPHGKGYCPHESSYQEALGLHTYC